MNRQSSIVFALALCATLASASLVSAIPFVLGNGPGDGTVTIGVDGFGAFGSFVGSDSSNAVYDPVGAQGAAGTTFESGVAIDLGDGTQFLTSGSIGTSGGLTNPVVVGDSTNASSSFSLGGLDFLLTQTLDPIFTMGAQTGSLLTQDYLITNNGNGTEFFDLWRYIDGDLLFDGSLIDGGGIIGSGADAILFETDSATGAADDTTFIGINAVGGVVPMTDRFELSSFSGLRSTIISASSLNNMIQNDGNNDGFVDAGQGFDVSLAFRNFFRLEVEESANYTTQTIFGNGAPGDVPTPMPEPSTAVVLLLGGAAMAALRRKQR